MVRDSKIDFLRGAVMCMLLIVHASYVSPLNFLVWERLGVFTSAECFVFISGVVAGLVYQNIIAKKGLGYASYKILRRSIQLYVLSVFVIVTISSLNAMIGFLDFKTVMTYVSNTGRTYNLYWNLSPFTWPLLKNALFLKVGPHQFQIIGFYAIVLAFSPLAFFLLKRNRYSLVLALSFIVYLLGYLYSKPVLGMMFEHAFALFKWQFLFFLAMVTGYNFEKMKVSLFQAENNLYRVPATIAFFCFMFFAWNNPATRGVAPEILHFNFIDPAFFKKVYQLLFSKKDLGIMRVLNVLVLFYVAYDVLDRYWSRLQQPIKLFFVTIGEHTLLVFVSHVYLLAIFHTIVPVNRHISFFSAFLQILILVILYMMSILIKKSRQGKNKNEAFLQ